MNEKQATSSIIDDFDIFFNSLLNFFRKSSIIGSMKRYKRYWNHFWYTLRHKFWVFYFCWKEGLHWRGIKHDWSKFLPIEFLAYARHFWNAEGNRIAGHNKDKTGYYDPFDHNDEGFKIAIWHHFRLNSHHWQYWTLPKDGGKEIVAISMPWDDIREMICDWRGAGRANKTPDVGLWYHKNKDKLVLHPYTRSLVERALLFGNELR